jgi:hypothetical protein
MRHLKYGLALAAMLAVPALAQTIPNPTGSQVVAPARFATYDVSYTAITTAASLTDFMTLTGSATKTIYVQRASCTGIASAAGTSSIAAVKRSAADTGGTPLTPSATVGGQLVPRMTSMAAATATAAAYSTNPTTGALVGVLRTGKIGLAAAAGNGGTELTFDFSRNNEMGLSLKGTGEVFALSGLGTALASGAVLSCNMTWIEQ